MWFFHLYNIVGGKLWENKWHWNVVAGFCCFQVKCSRSLADASGEVHQLFISPLLIFYCHFQQDGDSAMSTYISILNEQASLGIVQRTRFSQKNSPFPILSIFLFFCGLEISFRCYVIELVSSFKSILCVLLLFKAFPDWGKKRILTDLFHTYVDEFQIASLASIMDSLGGSTSQRFPCSFQFSSVFHKGKECLFIIFSILLYPS